ncbi:hypothetical protein [Mesorhizobium sp. Root552]|nr:hypothetical protein [Mesorhizobium sp. Root552]
MAVADPVSGNGDKWANSSIGSKEKREKSIALQRQQDERGCTDSHHVQ